MKLLGYRVRKEFGEEKDYDQNILYGIHKE